MIVPMRILGVVMILHLIFGCAQPSPDYFPLGAGLVYEYAIQHQVNEDVHQARLLIANQAAQTIAGKEVYPRVTAAREILYLQKQPGGIYYYRDLSLAGQLVLKYPLARDAAWRAASDIFILKRRHESFAGDESFISLGGAVSLDYRISALDEIIQVPAGRFEKCVRVDAHGMMPVQERTRGIDRINIEQSEWYAPDVGLVKVLRTEYTVPAMIRAQMTQELLSLQRD